MEREKIKLEIEYRGDKSTTFTGRKQGKQVRGKMQLDTRDFDDYLYIISIPAETTSINPSFYLGLFFQSIENLKGVEKFKKKYQFRYEDEDPEMIDILKDDIADCERQAYNEYNC